MNRSSGTQIRSSDHRLPGVYPGCAINLRQKARIDRDDSSKTILFVHGATYGSTSTFDYPVDGHSWMDIMAQTHDVWCLDLSGYGVSDRPALMDQPAEINSPLMTTVQAVQEVKIAIDYILAERGSHQISLIGYSWGSAICGSYAGQWPESVDRLILCGALWVTQNPKATAQALSAYRLVTAEEAFDRWIKDVSPERIDQMIDLKHARQWCEDVMRCDPAFDPVNHAYLRAPRGVQADYLHCAVTGEVWYAPERIQSSVLIVMGDHDIETTPDQGWQVFKRLANARAKQFSVLRSGTHSMLLESNRFELYEVCNQFLV